MASEGEGASPAEALVRPFFEDDTVTIYHGDCRQIVPLLGHFNLLLTDPPYGIKRFAKPNSRIYEKMPERATGLAWDTAVESWVFDMLKAKCDKQIIWGGNYYMLGPARCVLAWDKQNDGRDFAECEFAWTSLDAVARIRRIRPQNMDGGKEHPTQKPLALMKWCIQQAGDVQTILDPFAGSGTTGRAAKDMGKQAVLIEREERYCEIAAKRMCQQVLDLSA